MRARRFLKRATAFRRDETGSYSVELVIVLPVLVWTCLMMLNFVDAYRAQITNLRATYAIGDMLSREQLPTTRSKIEGLGRVYEHLAPGRDNTYMRISSVIWDESNRQHILVWSDVTYPPTVQRGPAPHTDRSLHRMIDRIPTLADGDSIILVETWLDYVPPFVTGFGAARFDNDIVTSPRFVPVLRYEKEAR